MGVNRRRHPRFELDLSAELSRADDGPAAAVRFRNISRGGAYFVAESRFEPGERVEIKLGDGLYFAGEVVRAEELPDGRHGFAVRFTRIEGDAAGTSLSREAKGWSSVYQLELKPMNDAAFAYYPPLERVRRWVSERFGEPIRLEDAASVAAMERTYFSAYFSRKVGVPFSAWLQYFRIGKALEMMERRDHSVTEVAFAVGFNELSSFQKAFKRWTSLTPRDFKRLARPA